MGDGLVDGYAALRSGDWAAAAQKFAAELAVVDSAEAHAGLGRALWCLGEVRTGLTHSELAYNAFRQGGRRGDAARLALWLARQQLNVFGSVAAAGGWVHRAERLLAEAGMCVEQGWLCWFRAKLSASLAASPAEAAAQAEQALRIAQECADNDLEVLALSELGHAHVLAGEVGKGLAELDEAVAAATGGEVGDLVAIGDACCNMLTACDAAGDVARGVQWCAVVDEFSRRYRLVPFFATCRTMYGAVLIATGRWADAETELLAAAQMLESGFPAVRALPVARLALLRVLQGRLQEASVLLVGYESFPVAAEAVAALHLAAGRPKAAAAVCRRRLAVVGEDTVAAAPFLALLAAAEPDSDAATLLSALAQRCGARPLVGMAALAQAASTATPRPGLDVAVTVFAEVGMVYHEALARLALAIAVADDDPQMAVVDAGTAEAVFVRLGATPKAQASAALLRRLDALGGQADAAGLSRREREVLALVGAGLTNPEIAARLFISPKTASVHVTHILAKLGVRNRTEAAAYALKHHG
jgi:DNA-binding CsgD family transcriptional regulator